jgi:pimeloyl-ACP methyl ester carboxylesterase
MILIRSIRPGRLVLGTATLAVAAVLLAGCLMPGVDTGGGVHPAPTPTGPKPTIVLVHGAWADASGWAGVITRLKALGYPVVAPANPLRSLDGDAAYLRGVLAQIPGPLVVVGHSYGGAVITNAAAGNPNVKALVYVAAFIPAIGEDILHLTGAASQVPASIELKGYPPFGEGDVDVYLRQDAFRSVFAQDVPAPEAAVMAATQRPLAYAAGAGATTAAAWSTIPSWALVATQDRTITPDQERSMARRAGATIVEVPSSHVAMISHPREVTDLILRAVRATS